MTICPNWWWKCLRTNRCQSGWSEFSVGICTDIVGSLWLLLRAFNSFVWFTCEIWRSNCWGRRRVTSQSSILPILYSMPTLWRLYEGAAQSCWIPETLQTIPKSTAVIWRTIHQRIMWRKNRHQNAINSKQKRKTASNIISISCDLMLLHQSSIRTKRM